MSVLSKKNILVRHFNHAGQDNFLRITVGNENENQLLLSTLQDLLTDN